MTSTIRHGFGWLGFLCCVLGSLLVGCGSPPECTVDANCQSGKLCKEGKCIVDDTQKAECTQDNDCPAESSCQKEKCVPLKPKPECTQNDDCKKGQVCEDEKCKTPPPPECESKQDCKFGQECEKGKCTGTPFECADDRDCAGKTKPYCSSIFRCEWECKLKTDCPKGKTCRDNKCELDGSQCTTDKDCVGQRRPYCSKDKLCEWGCRTDEDCPIRESCQENLCKPRSNVCSVNQKCEAGFVCWNEVCVKACNALRPKPGDCPDGYGCVSAQAGGQLYSGTGACLQECGKDKSCGWGMTCLPNGIIPDRTLNKPYCIPIVPLEGKLKPGEICSNSSDSGKTCNGKQDEVCLDAPFELYDGKCAKVCDPYKGTEGNPNCQSNEVCQRVEAHHITTHLGGACLPTGTQKEGEPCHNEPWKTLFCSKGLFCHSGQCSKPCDGSKGRLQNPDCSGDQICNPNLYSPNGASCFTPRKSGESCNLQKPCGGGLVCIRERCAVSCKTSSDCGSNQYCYSSGRSATGFYCVDSCDPTKGLVIHPDCKPGYYCALDVNLPSKAYCNPISPRPPTSVSGPRQVGETCFLSDPQRRQCDATKNLTCYVPVSPAVCVQMCDPQKGLKTNPDCGGASCIEAPGPSHLGGLCERIGTAKLGEVCSNTNGCEKGFICNGGKCVKSCSPKNKNDCSTGEFCWESRCLKSCDFSLGMIPNPACPKGTYCADGFEFQSAPFQPHCKSLANRQAGTRQEGQTCSRLLPGQQCDGSKDLVCSPNVCRKACDPNLGIHSNPNCKTGEGCFVDRLRQSHLGGLCGRICDVANGAFENTRCLEGTTCWNVSGGIQACLARGKQQGSKDLGDNCDERNPSLHCNQNKGLFCNGYGRGVCATACNPRKSGQCGTGEYCGDNPYSFLGGVCLKNPTRKLGESCVRNSGANDCITGLACHDKICIVLCDSAQGETNNPKCAKSQICVEVKLTFYLTPLARDACVAAPKPPGPSKLPDPSVGTKGLGENCRRAACDGKDSTNGRKGLYCFTGNWSCTKACDPKSPATCDANEACLSDSRSHLGGGCFPKPTLKKDDACSSKDSPNPCQNGLFCYGGKCILTCDAKNPTTCTSGEACETLTTSPTGAACRNKPSKKLGEVCHTTENNGAMRCLSGMRCLRSISYQASFCFGAVQKEGAYCDGMKFNCQSGLTCWGARCERACDPKKPTTCKSNEVCHASPSAVMGGVCLPK